MSTILVIDDEPLIAGLIQRSLAKEHDVTTLGDASDAEKLFASGRHFDLVLSDLSMRGMGGVELYELLRERDPAQARRVAFVTGGVFDAREAELLAASGCPCLVKPFGPRELQAFVASCLARVEGND